MFKEQKGITLIALVITIIVLLILAGVTIAMLSGNDSAPQKAQQAAQDTKVAEAKEQAVLDVVDKYTTFMAGKYAPAKGETAIDASDFLTWIKTSGNEVEARDGMFGASTSSGTITITPKTSGNKTVTGTITNGGAITWEEN